MKTFEAENIKDLGRSIAAIHRNTSILRDEFGYDAILVCGIQFNDGFGRVMNRFLEENIEGLVCTHRREELPTHTIIRKLDADKMPPEEVQKAWGIPKSTFYKIRAND